METKTVTIPIRITFSDRVRGLKIKEAIDITGKDRGSVYSHACNAFPKATFRTQKEDGKVYLIRTA